MLSSMVRRVIWLSVWTSIWTVGSAGPIDNENKPKGLKLDIAILHGNTLEDASLSNTPGLVKRSGDSVLELTNMATYYQADIYVGSHRDKCTVHVDTGSSDLWVIDYSAICLRPSSTNNGLPESLIFRSTPDSDTSKSNDFSEFDESVPYFDDDFEDPDDDDNFEDFEDDNEESEGFDGYELDSSSFESISDFGNDSRGKRSMSKRDPGSKPSPESTSNNTKTTSNAPVYERTTSCFAFGSFDQYRSKTFKLARKPREFNVINSNQEHSSGFWGTDTIGFANANIRMKFGVALSTQAIQGTLGIGPVSGEMFNGRSGGPYPYENFPARLKSSGIIKKTLYSVYLNKEGTQKGSILFGAVDHKKYSGQLRTVPFVNLYRHWKLFDQSTIALSHIYLENEHQKVTILNQNIGAVLESSSDFQELPESVVRALAHSLQAQYSTQESLFQVDCGYKHDAGKLVYNFSGIKIRIPVGELIIESYGSCFLAVQSTSEDENNYAFGYLGTRFLRNAYVVYNLEDFEISLAQVHYTDEEDVEEVTKSVPRARKAKRYSSTSLVTKVTQLPTEIFKLSPKNSNSQSNGRT